MGSGGLMLTRRQFSKYFAGAAPAAFGLRYDWAVTNPTRFEPQPAKQDYDLLIKGGTVVDPAQKLHGLFDVAVKDGKIAEVAPNISSGRSQKTVSAVDRIVTPGLIDVHVHVFDKATAGGINADRTCLAHGVTTAVDGGSAGYPAIAGFRKYVAETSATRLYALVDIGALGTLVGVTDTLKNLSWVDPKLTAKAAEENKPVVVGIKARLSQEIVGTDDLEIVKRAREAAEISKLPMMLHIGNTPSPLKDILNLMRPGDIITHCYTPRSHGIVDENGRVLSEVVEARNRGILFDIGHGTSHFGFDLAEKCMQQDFLPDTISTDLAAFSVNGPTYDLVTVLSKFLLLNMSLDKVIELVTMKANHTFNLGLNLGSLQVGTPADISVLQLASGSFELVDTLGKKRTARQKLLSTAVIRDGKVIEVPVSK
jgi:dihydroorotase